MQCVELTRQAGYIIIGSRSHTLIRAGLHVPASSWLGSSLLVLVAAHDVGWQTRQQAPEGEAGRPSVRPPTRLNQHPADKYK